ncbi:MAG: hypothetical protein ACKVY0_30240 [Prosthecobacter sp.]|uniref:hypothetical protein n=1 Tax=Prosthecobacter sp. TaxID=1965333 RepID=UPI0038FD56D0
MKIRPLNRPPGFISLGGIVYMAVIVLLIVGGQGVYVALKNPEPLKITVADYIAKKPNAEWMTLQEAQVSLVEAAYKARLGKVSEVFIPVRPVGESTDVPVHILLSTNNQAVVAALQHLSGSGGTLEKKVDTAAQQADKLFMWQDITGLTRYGIFYDLLMRARLAKLNMKLAEDFVILNDGASPDLLVSLAMVVGGLLIWFLMVCQAMRNALWRWRRRRAFYRQRAEER